MEPLEVGRNGAIVPVTKPSPGLVFRAPDGTLGPFHAKAGGWMAAFVAARRDWRAWVDAHPSAPLHKGSNLRP